MYAGTNFPTKRFYFGVCSVFFLLPDVVSIYYLICVFSFTVCCCKYFRSYFCAVAPIGRNGCFVVTLIAQNWIESNWVYFIPFCEVLIAGVFWASRDVICICDSWRVTCARTSVMWLPTKCRSFISITVKPGAPPLKKKKNSRSCHIIIL
jgi:hypothetical protein